MVTGVFGASNCSARAAADGWPHPGLAGFSTPLTLHPAAWVCRGSFQRYHTQPAASQLWSRHQTRDGS